MRGDRESGWLEGTRRDPAVVADSPRKGPRAAVVILCIVVFDFIMWFIVPDGTIYHRDFGATGLDVYLSPIPLIGTGLGAAIILLILWSPWRKRH